MARNDVVVAALGLVLAALMAAGALGQAAGGAMGQTPADAQSPSQGPQGSQSAPAAQGGQFLLKLAQAMSQPAQSGGQPAQETDVPAGSEKVELHCNNADLLTELQLLAKQNKLNLVAGKDVTGKVTADLYGVTVDEALHAVLEMNGYGYRRVGSFVYVYTKRQLQELEAAEAKLQTKTFSLNYINVDDARELVKPALSKSGIVAATSRAKEGIPSGGEAVGGDSYSLQDKLVVTDFEDNLKEVEKILKACDVRPKEVLVEATILQVTLEDEASLGVDFNLLAGVDFHEISTTNFSLTNPNSNVAGSTAAHTSIPWGRAGTTGFATAGTGFQVGVITDSVSLFIQALETVKDVNVLSNPKVLALNKQRAEVLVGNRWGYKTTTTTTTAEIETIEFLETGTQLQFRPFISDDGFIRMEVHPKVSDGGVDAAGLPSETTTEVTCNVMVRDGHTIVIGGLFEETTQKDKSQVPGLGDVPVVGTLFGKDHNKTKRREIIVLLTPHIIDHPLASAEGREALKHFDRTVSQLRSRFPLYTREKLTQLYLGEAEKCYNRYLASRSEADRGATLWNLKHARHVAPNNQEVYDLLGQLQAEEVVKQPRLRNESVLWKRMMEQGLLKELPAATPRGTSETDKQR